MPPINFDDFLDGPTQGGSVDGLATKFGLTRNLNETDAALMLRIEAAAGYTGAGTHALLPITTGNYPGGSAP